MVFLGGGGSSVYYCHLGALLCRGWFWQFPCLLSVLSSRVAGGGRQGQLDTKFMQKALLCCLCLPCMRWYGAKAICACCKGMGLQE